jgi:hypothetical protein
LDWSAGELQQRSIQPGQQPEVRRCCARVIERALLAVRPVGQGQKPPTQSSTRLSDVSQTFGDASASNAVNPGQEGRGGSHQIGFERLPFGPTQVAPIACAGLSTATMHHLAAPRPPAARALRCTIIECYWEWPRRQSHAVRILVHACGRISERTGDGSVVEFRSVADAVRCAIEVQWAMVERNVEVTPDKRIEFRVTAGAVNIL